MKCINQNITLTNIRNLFLIILFYSMTSCTTDYGEIIITNEKEGRSEYSFSHDSFIDFYNVKLRNNSQNKIITFTVQKDIKTILFEGENFKFDEPYKKKSSSNTHTYKLNPGELKSIGKTGNIDKSHNLKYEREYSFAIVGQLIE